MPGLCQDLSCHMPALLPRLPRALGFGVPGGLVALRSGTGSPRATIHLLPGAGSGARGVGKAGAGGSGAGLAWEPTLGWEEKAP